MKENEKFGSWTVINETFELNPKPKSRKKRLKSKKSEKLNVKIDTINVKENN